MKTISRHTTIKVIILVLGISYCAYVAPKSFVWAAIKTKLFDITKSVDIREGDLMFQHLPGELLEVIADVTNSPYSHCGIVIQKEGQLYVLEAIGPVKVTPLNQWVHRGIGSKVTIVRLKEEYRKKIPNIIAAAFKYKGLPYDIQYEWDDEKIYCSELIYKAAWEGAGIRLAKFRELGELNWGPHEEFIREIAGGTLPLDRQMITPVDLVVSDKVEMVYSTFDKRQKGLKTNVATWFKRNK